MSEVHTFVQFIAEAEDGRLAQDLSTELADIAVVRGTPEEAR